MNILISMEKLLSGKFVEGAMMEFKKGWNSVPILRTIIAFANDLLMREVDILLLELKRKTAGLKRVVK